MNVQTVLGGAEAPCQTGYINSHFDRIAERCLLEANSAGNRWAVLIAF